MIRVQKIADIVDNMIVVNPRGRMVGGDVAAVLTNMAETDDPLPGAPWQISLLIGEGPSARLVVIDLPKMLSKSDSLDNPKFIHVDSKHHDIVRMVVYFRDRLFMPERLPLNAAEREEIVLRVKKAVYEEDIDVSSLRDAVSNLEAAMEFRKSGQRRELIPEDVKLVVWARDGGACTRCGSKKNLHFDHIIPVVKGGGNSAENIQVLCQTCNLMKADKIAIT
jgi:hypothetical protein